MSHINSNSINEYKSKWIPIFTISCLPPRLTVLLPFIIPGTMNLLDSTPMIRLCYIYDTVDFKKEIIQVNVT